MRKVIGVLVLTLTLRTAVTGQTNTTDEAYVCSSSTQMLYAAVEQVEYLSSPGYPGNYPNNVDCRWLIDAGGWDSNDVVKVTILTARMESCCDYVQLYDSSYSYASLSLVKFYSMPGQTVYYSSGQYMYIKFITNGSVTSSGFTLTYEAVDRQNASTPSPALTTTTDVATVCSSSGVYTDVYYGQPKVLSFTRYTYSSLNCLWIIRSADINDYFNRYIIHVIVEDFTLSSCSLTDCSCGYLQVFDGDSDSGASLGRVCNSSYPATHFYSSGTYATVRVYTRGYSYFSASFRLRYESVPRSEVSTTPCPVYTPPLNALVGQTGYLTSPNYPMKYESNTNCQWLVDTGSLLHVVKVTVSDASMEQCSTCCDYLQLFDGRSALSPSLVKLCSMASQPVYYSSGQYMFIQFFSDSAITYSGFSLTYEAVYSKQSLPPSGQSQDHLTAVVVGGVLGAAFLVIVIVLIYVLRCRRQSLRPTNTYLYNEASGSSTSNLLYTTATSPPAYNSVYVVGAPPPYPGIATPYPISGFTNGAFVPTETAEEGAAANPSSVLREQEAKVQPPTEGDSPPPYSTLEESLYANVAPPCSTLEESVYSVA